MTKAEKQARKLTKKVIRKEIMGKLSDALAEYKDKVNQKRFETNLKKASKLFSVDIVKAINKDRKNKGTN